jgi:hypothetical protein
LISALGAFRVIVFAVPNIFSASDRLACQIIPWQANDVARSLKSIESDFESHQALAEAIKLG